MTERAKDDVAESKEEIDALSREIDDLAAEMQQELAAARTRWAATAETTTEIPVSPYKKDVHAALFGVAWFPYYLLPDGGELPAFAQEQS